MTIKIDSKDYDEDKVHQIKMKINMKEHNFPLDSFIGGWYIDPKICDSLIQLFKDNKKLQKPGVIGGPYNVNKEQKNSMDIGVELVNPDIKELKVYTDALNKCSKLYSLKYPEVQDFFQPYGLVEGGNIQYYPPGGGYFASHCERISRHENRCLVFVTYLNDVPNGGTHFKYQKMITEPKKGLTVIFPPDFTHTHRGQISKEHEKYIITGWFGFLQ
jgi:hypothetical protein|tara:strand:+ start:4570 stop:5217 length:648 start_codon:yes stop_codon:yes gene_type:complete